jgi:hypothetical protein
LIGTPNVKEDELFDRSAYPLHGVTVDSYAGFLFVNLSGEPRPLIEALTDGAESITAFERFKMDELRVGVRLVYEVEANWKIVVENYNECLHCPQIHPELVQVVPLFRFGEVWDEEIRDDGNRMIEGATSFTISGTSELPKLPDLAPEDYEMYYGSYEFPNLMLNLHPDCGMYYIGFPKGPNHTTVVSEFLFRPETIAGPNFRPEPVVVSGIGNESRCRQRNMVAVDTSPAISRMSIGHFFCSSSVNPCSSPHWYFSPFHLITRSTSLARSEAVNPGGRSWKKALVETISGRLWQDTQSNRKFSVIGSLRTRLAATSRIMRTRFGNSKMSAS